MHGLFWSGPIRFGHAQIILIGFRLDFSGLKMTFFSKSVMVIVESQKNKDIPTSYPDLKIHIFAKNSKQLTVFPQIVSALE